MLVDLLLPNRLFFLKRPTRRGAPNGLSRRVERHVLQYETAYSAMPTGMQMSGFSSAFIPRNFCMAVTSSPA